MKKKSSAPFAGGDLFDDTKDHVLTAGRELVLAAQGMLKFCKMYVDTSSEARFKPCLAGIIEKAKSVADELAREMSADALAKRGTKTKPKGKGRRRRAKPAVGR